MVDHRRRPAISLAIAGLGFSALVSQLVFMRELVSAFSGSELVFGIVLGNWFLLTGIGAALGRRVPRLQWSLGTLILAQLAIALLPVAGVFVLRSLRDVVFLRGSEVGVTETVAGVLVLLAPYCLVMGYVLTLACSVFEQGEGGSIGRVYFLDSAGSIGGGLLFTFVLVYWFNHFTILYFPALVNLALAALVAVVFRQWKLACVVMVVSMVSVAIIGTWDLETISTENQYPGQQIRFQANSPYGRLVVAESRGQLSFLSNGVLLFSTQNAQEVEQTVHYAMIQRPKAQRVLLVSGGASGTAKEVLKYPLATVDDVELDPLVVDVARQLLPESLADPRIEVIHADGRHFVRETDRRYDVVIVDVAGPSTSQLNRFYTREFFQEVQRILRPHGVLSLAVGHYENYLSPELGRLLGIAHRTLSEVFANVEALPAGRVFFLASDGPLIAGPAEMADRLQEHGIATRFVRRHDLEGNLTPDRLGDVRRAIATNVPVNRDFNPILYYYHLRYWMSQFKIRFGLMEGLLVMGAAVYLVRLRPVPLAIFSGGFAASALEVVLLLAFQVLYGSVYHRVGLVVAMFMIGLGVGSYAMNHMLPRSPWRRLAQIALAMAIYAAVLPAALAGLGYLSGSVLSVVTGQAVISLSAFILAVLVGLEFPLAAKIDFQSTASTAARLYMADYVGSALGALLVSTLLIPLLGVTAVCFLAAGLNLASGAVILVRGRR